MGCGLVVLLVCALLAPAAAAPQGTSQILLVQSPEGSEVVSEEPAPQVPVPRSEHSMAMAGPATLFVFGGQDEEKRPLEDLWQFNLNDNVWTEGSGSEGSVSPSARFWHTLTATDDGAKLYLFGGYDGRNDLNDLWRYAPAQNEWLRVVPGSNKPLPRDRHSMVMHGNDPVVFGGYIGTYTNDVWRYSPATNQWGEVVTRESPPRRRSHGAAVVGDRMFVFGGNNADHHFADLWELDLVQNMWTEIRSARRPAKRTRCRLIGNGAGHLVLFGGFDGQGYKQDMWVYTDQEGWVKLTETAFDRPAERAAHAMVFQKSPHAVDKGRVFMFGGTDGPNKYNDVFKYEFASRQWRQLVPVLE